MSFANADQLSKLRRRPGASPTGGKLDDVRLDAGAAARVGYDAFEQPERFNLPAPANRAFGIEQNEEEDDPTAWRFRRETAEQARGFPLHPDEVLGGEPDRSLGVRFRASGRSEMCRSLHASSSQAKVPEPAVLRRKTEPCRRTHCAVLP